MKNFILLFLIILSFLLISMGQCSIEQKDYRQLMREFVKNISIYAKNLNQNFIIIPQNGVEIINDYYLNHIDGIGQEDFFYGYYDDDIETPENERNYLLEFINLAKEKGKKVLIIDYCFTQGNVDNSYNENYKLGFISFAADRRELDKIPSYPVEPYNINQDNIEKLSDAKNFLYLINPASFSSKQQFINELKNTDYDIIIIDLFFNEEILTSFDIEQLKLKKNGRKRLVICYMSIGEAEDYRYYWRAEWETNPPSFLCEQNPNWPGNYKVKYWDPLWQSIIYGNETSYLKKIIDVKFDGVYLDIIDAYEYFENK